MAFVPREGTSLLSYIENVRALSLESPTVDPNGFLHMTAVLALVGEGIWRGEIKVFVGKSTEDSSGPAQPT